MQVNRPTPKPVALGALTADETSLAGRLKRAACDREHLARSLRSALPNLIKPHLVGAELKNDRLVLVADSAVWAARMRFYASDVLKYMAALHSSAITRVDVRIRPQGMAGEKPPFSL